MGVYVTIWVLCWLMSFQISPQADLFGPIVLENATSIATVGLEGSTVSLSDRFLALNYWALYFLQPNNIGRWKSNL